MQSNHPMTTGTEAFRCLQQWPDGLMGIDRHNNLCFFSTQAEVLLGWLSEGVYGRNVHELLCLRAQGFEHEQTECPLCQPLPAAHIVRSSFWLNSEGYSISVDFRVIPVVGTGAIARLVSFQNNQHHAHSSEEAAKLLAYVENNPSPIGEFDANGQVLFSNSAFNDALLAFGFNDLGQSRMLPASLEQICRDCLLQQAVKSSVEVEVDGRWLTWHFVPLAEAGARAVALAGYAFDITDQKNLELQNEQEKARLRRDFYAKMVHELRTPLNAIIGFSQVLLKRVTQKVEERDLANLRAIKTAGLQLNQMISNTLDVSRIEAGKMEVEVEHFHVKELFVGISEQLASLANAKGLAYEIECSDGLNMTSDLDKVRQIMVNLLSNAIKYTNTGGIYVSVTPTQGADALLFVIRDSGIGIAEEHLSCLFSAYGRVHARDTHNIQGMGLGLVLVAEFVEMLHGTISVQSQKHTGTTFTVVLPINGINTL